jgi:hypothetical protein
MIAAIAGGGAARRGTPSGDQHDRWRRDYSAAAALAMATANSDMNTHHAPLRPCGTIADGF